MINAAIQIYEINGLPFPHFSDAESMCFVKVIRNNYSGGPFLHPFFAGALFCTVFAPPKKQNKKNTHGFRRKIDKNFG